MICLNFALTIDMSVKVKDVIRALELFAPLPLQESYDNAGLQVGLTEAEVSGALLCLDVTEEVIAEAREMDCDLIVSHHPLLFRGLKRITDSTQVERCVRMALQYNIAIYSAHTNLDNAEDGVNYRIAEKLGLQDVELMMPRRVMVSIEDTIRGFKMILDGECDELPEQAFLNVGTIEEAFEKAEKLKQQAL